MIVDRPYRVEYSKSGRAKCKVCGDPIAQDVLRIATFVQSSAFDGKVKEWHHTHCFFQEYRPKGAGDFANFDNVRWKDQEFIKQKIEQRGAPEAGSSTSITASTSSESSGHKRSKDMAAENTNADFKAEYTGSDPTECRVCGKMIAEGEIRLSKRDSKSGSDCWHHVECFAKLRSELQFFDEGTNIPGVTSLSKEDQNVVKKVLPKIEEKENVSPEAKKIKPEPEDDEEEKDLKAQQEKLFAMRDKLASLKKKELIEMLEDNEQKVPSGQNEILDALADALLFGALEPCPICCGRLGFESGTGYKCTKVFEWMSCEYNTINPERKKFAIAEELKEKHPFLSDFEPQVEQRLIKITKPSTLCAGKKEDLTDGPEIQKKPPPLKYFTFVLAGFSEEKAEELTKEIVSLGGTIKYKVMKYTTAVIATQDEVKKSSNVIEDARDVNVHVVSEDFVEEAKHLTHNVYSLFDEKRITDWGDWPMLRVLHGVVTGYVPRDMNDYVSSGKKKLIVKGAGIVDIESGLTDVAHVYQRGEDKFTISLAKVDAQANKNSYYKMQILEHDNKEEYWFFRKWGRTGTTIGDNKCDKMSRDECIEKFESLFRDKTGNSWWDHKNCPKEPGKWYPIPTDIDEGDDNRKLELLKFKAESRLKKPVQDLMRLIFSVDLMKKAMLEYDIDMHKMPLGKISKTQIEEANLVLSELLILVRNGVQDRTKFIKASNRFYTLIPHNFGIDSSNIIETEKQIRAKSDMLEALSKMEIAYNLLQFKTDTKQNPLDTHYEQLNAEIDVLDHESDMFKLIELYVKNTHGKFHDKYELVVEEVFTVKRDGEESQFEPYKNFSNRKLLWHGSGVTNYAGILSQGLRIAPPEAPPTGYMFGKGVYFADMVSKSANYCNPSPENTTGFVLLCEVALGNMYELLVGAPNLEKSPDGYHSVWGRGPIQPDPEKSVMLKTGVEVPCGPLLPVELQQKSDLRHNEFIVYDVAQVKIQFLVKLRYIYKKVCKK